MADAFKTDIFKKYFDNSNLKSLQMSNIGDTPTYSLLSEGLGDGPQDDSLLNIAIGNDNPVNEVAPAENNAQSWERNATSLQGENDSYLNPKPEQSSSGFLHLHNMLLGEDGQGSSRLKGGFDVVHNVGNTELNYDSSFDPLSRRQADIHAQGLRDRGFRVIDAHANPDPTASSNSQAFHDKFGPATAQNSPEFRLHQNDVMHAI